MSEKPTLVFVPGAWHKPQCYDKIIKILQDKHNIKCLSVTLPSTMNNPNATFKDDVDAARQIITAETTSGRDVIVISHSYGGIIGSSSIKGLTRNQKSATASSSEHGYVKAQILIASGFAITGLALMDPLFGIPPPFWRINKETGYAEFVQNPRDFLYHDVPQDEADYWVSQLMTQSLKALFEGGEFAYDGWKGIPNWYIGTSEDKALPVVMQRVGVGMARAQGGVVYHTELQASHSPFLSMPDEVVAIIMQAVAKVTGDPAESVRAIGKVGKIETPAVRLFIPSTWFRFGIPLFIGRLFGWGFSGYYGLKKLWRGNDLKKKA